MSTRRFVYIGMFLGAVAAGFYGISQMGGTSGAQMYGGGAGAVVATATEHDTMTGVITFVWDDNSKELSPQHDSLYVDALRSRGFYGGLAIEPQAIQYGDTVATTLSINDVRNLINSGWEAGTVGWDEISGLYHGDTGLIATGAYATPDTFYTNLTRAVLAQRDSLGLGAPKWISHSNSSAAWVTNQAAARAGLTYGYAPGQTATAGSGDGERPNVLYPLSVARYGAWGTGGAGGAVVAATPTARLNRYEIRQTIGESNTFAQWKNALNRAAQTKGLFVFIGHKPSSVAAGVDDGLWSSSIGAVAVFDSLMSYIKIRYIDTGLLTVKTPGDAADYYFRDTFSPVMNHLPDAFSDIDGDGHYDWWFSGRGHQFAAADTAFLNLMPGSVRHGSSRSASLGWAGEGNGTVWDGQTADAAWESSKATLCVMPPQGAGWTVQFECWAICDTTVAGWTAGAAPQATDTMGVTFGGPMETYTNRWGTGIPLLTWTKDASGTMYAPSMSHPMYTSSQAPGNLFRFTARNNLHGKGEWLHLVTTWDIPAFSDYLFVSIWKTAQAPTNGIIISDYSVSFYKR